jgi:hypothetical protein
MPLRCLRRKHRLRSLIVRKTYENERGLFQAGREEKTKGDAEANAL